MRRGRHPLKDSVQIGRSGMAQLQAKAQTIGDLLVWTIYDHPSDYPDMYVVRPFSSRMGQALTVVFARTSLELVRGALENMGLACITRGVTDDPCILETWL